MPAFPAPPGAAQNQHVGETVVIVIGLNNIQPTNFTGQSGLGSALGEGAIAIVDKESQLGVQPDVRHHHIEKPVAIEVLKDGPTGQAGDVQAKLRSDIGKSRYLVFGCRSAAWLE